MNRPPRLPDYVIAGMMKSGTLSLYAWLAQQPECEPAGAKEPDFFSNEDAWKRGPSWYGEMFAHAPEGKLVGEASTSYTKPYEGALVAATRMAALLPDVRLIFVLREPIARLRSHYRHEVRRGRECRSFSEAISAPLNPYAALSHYHECLSPYFGIFPRAQICIIRMEDLISETARGWTQVLHHLGLPPRPALCTAHNVTAAQPSYTRAMLWLWEAGHYRRLRHRLPGPVRRVARAVLLRDTQQDQVELCQRWEGLPTELTGSIVLDVRRLERWLGVSEPLWEELGSGTDHLPSPTTRTCEPRRRVAGGGA